MPSLKNHPPTVAAAKAVGGKRTRYAIEGVKGLVLDCPVDAPRSWYCRYQVGHGAGRKERFYRLGSFEPKTDDYLTLGQAIDRAAALRVEARRNKRDVFAEERKPSAAGETVETMYRSWLANPARKRTLRPLTIASYEGIYRNHLGPELGHALITELTKPMVREAIDNVFSATKDEAAGQRGVQATKTLSILRSICKFALDNDVIEKDPTRGIDDPTPLENPGARRHRPLTDAELRAVWIEGATHLSPAMYRINQLALLLGKRVSEIVGIRKNEVTFGRDGVLRVPGERTGNKSRTDAVVPLPTLAQSILHAAFADAAGSDFVFPHRNKPGRGMNRNSPSIAFRRFCNGLGIASNVRFHDSRGLIIDHLSRMRVPREYRSHVLHHTHDMKATLADSVYSSHDYMDEKLRALQLWSLRLQEIVRDRRPRGLRW